MIFYTTPQNKMSFIVIDRKKKKNYDVIYQ